MQSRPAMGKTTLQDWTQDRLERFVRGFRIGPSQLPPSITQKDVGVTGKLGVTGDVTLSDQAASSVAAAVQPHITFPSTDRNMAYVEQSSDVSITVTTRATAVTLVSAGAVTFDGTTPVIIEYFTPKLEVGNATSLFTKIVLYDGSSAVGSFDHAMLGNTGTGIVRSAIRAVARITPSAGSHTYSFRAYVDAYSSGTANVAASNSTFGPAFIRIQKDN